MTQKDDLMRNIAKIAAAVGLTWIGYKIVTGLSKNQSATQIVQETVKPIEKAAAEVKSISKKLLKGSPEAKERMSRLRSMQKKKSVPAVEMKESNSSEQKSDKVTAGKKGGNATAKLGKHKGHSTKAGLVQDQKKGSKEKHEKHYRQTKNHKGFDSYYGK